VRAFLFISSYIRGISLKEVIFMTREMINEILDEIGLESIKENEIQLKTESLAEAIRHIILKVS
jgi:hypothetical protein